MRGYQSKGLGEREERNCTFSSNNPNMGFAEMPD
jgi:hypothetical protein